MLNKMMLMIVSRPFGYDQVWDDVDDLISEINIQQMVHKIYQMQNSQMWFFP